MQDLSSIKVKIEELKMKLVSRIKMHSGLTTVFLKGNGIEYIPIHLFFIFFYIFHFQADLGNELSKKIDLMHM